MAVHHEVDCTDRGQVVHSGRLVFGSQEEAISPGLHQWNHDEHGHWAHPWDQSDLSFIKTIVEH
eukprot:7110010-Prorocentrum_lima.AAC.1